MQSPSQPAIADRGYAHPERLVSTEWVATHLDDENVRIVESNEDPLLYHTGHIRGAVEIDWTHDLNHPISRDYVDQEGFTRLCQSKGITRDMTVVFYGDRNNWWATYALWVFTLYGHPDVRIMDGGRGLWVKEGRELTKEVPTFAETVYEAPIRDDKSERAFREDVMNHLGPSGSLIDVRSPQEFSGERLHMADYPNEGALRGGHIPGAANVPWARAVDPETGEYLPADKLRSIYEGECGLSADKDAIVYCRIGERSAHTWFALKYLLGYLSVRNYDGSWTEWGNSVGLPIER